MRKVLATVMRTIVFGSVLLCGLWLRVGVTESALDPTSCDAHRKCCTALDTSWPFCGSNRAHSLSARRAPRRGALRVEGVGDANASLAIEGAPRARVPDFRGQEWIEFYGVPTGSWTGILRHRDRTQTVAFGIQNNALTVVRLEGGQWR